MHTRGVSGLQEKKVAKAIGGRKQSNSGATAFYKGDVVTEDFCIECKTMMTEKKSVTLQSEWIEKIKEEGFAMGKPEWAVVFNFGGLDSSENFYVISESLFKKLVQFMHEEKTYDANRKNSI